MSFKIWNGQLLFLAVAFIVHAPRRFPSAGN